MHTLSDPAHMWDEIQRCIAELSVHRGTRNAWEFSPASTPLPSTEVLFTSSTLEELLDRYATAHNTDHRISASQIWKMYCYWSVLPLTVGWLTNGCVPDLRAQHVHLSVPHNSAQIFFSLPDPQFFTGDDAFIKGAQCVLDENLFPALERVHTASGMGRRILTGTIASSALRAVGPLSAVLGRSLHEYAETLHAALGRARKLVTLAEVQTHPEAPTQIHPKRTTCCQKMRIPGKNNCMNCPLITEQKRHAMATEKGLTWLGSPTLRTTA